MKTDESLTCGREDEVKANSPHQSAASCIDFRVRYGKRYVIERDPAAAHEPGGKAYRRYCEKAGVW